ncbi:hypothetical protein [Asanoa hainanensis]|nr:hypothetical protein [Asanoa hainanensis]
MTTMDLIPADAVPRFQTRPDGGLDIDTVYTRCPQCGIVATSTGVDYAITAGGDFDPGEPVELACPALHHYRVTVADFLPRDASCFCVRCGSPIVVPATADQVVCLTCRLYQDGPARPTDAVSHFEAADALSRPPKAALKR